MEGWIWFAKIVFYFGVGFFAILAVIVAVGGVKDIRSLFTALDQQHKDQAGK